MGGGASAKRSVAHSAIFARGEENFSGSSINYFGPTVLQDWGSVRPSLCPSLGRRVRPQELDRALGLAFAHGTVQPDMDAAAGVRACSACTFHNIDQTVSACAMCSEQLPPVASSCRQSSTRSGSACPAVPGEVDGHVVCGWPLNSGGTCTYSARSDHVKRHRDEIANHSDHRNQLVQSAVRQSGGLLGMFKRPRASENPTLESSARKTSTRQPPTDAAAASTGSSGATLDRYGDRIHCAC